MPSGDQRRGKLRIRVSNRVAQDPPRLALRPGPPGDVDDSERREALQHRPPRDAVGDRQSARAGHMDVVVPERAAQIAPREMLRRPVLPNATRPKKRGSYPREILGSPLNF